VLEILARSIGAATLDAVAIDPGGSHLALITRHADFESDVFATCVQLANITARGALSIRWQEGRPGAHTLRFAPATSELAFLEADAGPFERVVVLSWPDAKARIVAGGLGTPARIVWASAGRGLIVCSTDPPDDDDVLLAATIPERLPWMTSSTTLRYIPIAADSTSEARTICQAPGEVEHLAVSQDGRWLMFAQSICPDGCSREHQLRRIDLEGLAEAPALMLPTPILSTPAISPSGRYVAYIGGRRPWLTETGARPVWRELLASAAPPVNGYDTRVCVIDLDTDQTRILSSDADLCAGIPVGLSAGHPEIRWHDDDIVTFVATQGHRTVIATQSIDDDGTLATTPVGNGSSRSHCFTDHGSCALLHSEAGTEFRPALWTSRRGVRMLSGARSGSPSAQRDSRAPVPIESCAAAGAWLWQPTIEAPTPWPLIVTVYGGAAPLTLAYDETQQALAARGYAVLVINPSGCAGYGPGIADRHIDDWGERATAEVVATTRQVLNRSADLDTSRVGIYGGSYGGFLVLRIAATTQLFDAAASLAGFSNLASYVAGSRTGYEYAVAATGLAKPSADAQLFTARSPLFHADRITAPVLLIHGECDSVVPLEESQQMFVALRALGRPVHLVIIPNEDHPMRSRPSARLVHQRFLIAWFDNTLRGEHAEWDSLTPAPRLGAGSLDRMRASAATRR
jgi:dipeptidyl aminopeptidase/acylaminoacyl peptidase